MNNEKLSELVQSSAEVVASFGGPSAVLGVLFNLIWYGFCLLVLAVFAALGIYIAYRVYRLVSGASAGGILSGFLREALSAWRTAELPAIPVPGKVTEQAPPQLYTLEEALALKDSILGAVEPMAAANDPAIQAAKTSQTEIDALRKTVSFLAGKKAVTQ